MALVNVEKPKTNPRKLPDYKATRAVAEPVKGSRKGRDGRHYVDVGAAWYYGPYVKDGQQHPGRLSVLWSGASGFVQLVQGVEDPAVFASQDGLSRAEVRADRNGQQYLDVAERDAAGVYVRGSQFFPNKYKPQPEADARQAEGAVMAAVLAGSADVDGIVSATELPEGAVLSALDSLVRDGRVVEDGVGVYAPGKPQA